MNVLVTNIPSVYRVDLYEKLVQSDWRLLFYDRHSPALKYCCEDHPPKFPFEDITLASLLRRLIVLQPNAVVCINASPYTLICGIYARLFQKRFVIWWAGTMLSEANVGTMKRLFRRLVFSMTDAFIVYSEHAGYYLSRLGIEEQKMINLGNMTFDPTKFRAIVDRKRSMGMPHAPTLLSVANLIKRKNHKFLLDVLVILRQRFPDLRLIVAGEGSERRNLEEIIQKKGLEGVQLRGNVPHDTIPALFAEADVFVHPAIMDQWPQVINEAMAAGVPVVASPQSGVSQELFVIGEELLMPELDTSLFAEAIVSLLEDTSLRARMASAAAQKVTAIYSATQQKIEHACGIAS